MRFGKQLHQPSRRTTRNHASDPRAFRRAVLSLAVTGILASGLPAQTPLGGRDPGPTGRPPAGLLPPPLPGGGIGTGGQASPATGAFPPLPPLADPLVAQPGTMVGNQNGNVPGESELATGRAAFAERFAGDGVNVLQKYLPTPALLQYTAAELEMAARLNSDEPRYLRLLSEAWIDLGNAEGAIKTLTAYRDLLKSRNQKDQFSEVRLIELYLAGMQRNPDKIRYLLVEVMNNEALDPEIRSYAAARAVPLLFERSRADAAMMTRRAIELNPLNPQARKWEWALVASQGSPAERLVSLLAQIRCDPADLPVLQAIAVTVSSAGLASPSLEWFERARIISLRTNSPLSEEFAMAYASQLYRAGLYEQSNRLLGDMLAQKQDIVDGWFMALSLHRDTGGGGGMDQELAQVKRLLVNRATESSRKILTAANLPTTGGADNIGRTAQALADDPKIAGESRRDFVEAVSDLAWFESFYNRRADNARSWITALSKIVPPNDQTLVRLQGWTELADNNVAAARARFAPIQDRDALAALGMIAVLRAEAGVAAVPPGPATLPAAGPTTNRSMPSTNPAPLPGANPAKLAEAEAISRRILAQNPTGLLGMTLAAELRGPGGKLDLEPLAQAAAVKAELDKFPAEFMRIIEPESGTGGPSKFYLVVGRPLSSSNKLGEPMLAEIKLQNLSKYDLAVGPGATIRPDLWWDAKVSSTDTRNFPAAGYDKIAGLLVLKAKSGNRDSTSSQVVRVDQGPMGELLAERPAASMNVYLTVLTNPIDLGQEVDVSPSGLRRRFSSQLIRRGTPVSNEAQKAKLYEQALKGLPAAKMQVADVFAAYVRQSRDKTAEVNLLLLSTEMSQQLEKMRADPVPHVAAWATLLAARLANPSSRDAMLASLAQSPLPECRLLAVQGSDLLPSLSAKTMLDKLSRDADPTVQLAARAKVELLAKPPTPRVVPASADNSAMPTTRPATTAPSGATESGAAQPSPAAGGFAPAPSGPR